MFNKNGGTDTFKAKVLAVTGIDEYRIQINSDRQPRMGSFRRFKRTYKDWDTRKNGVHFYTNLPEDFSLEGDTIYYYCGERRDDKGNICNLVVNVLREKLANENWFNNNEEDKEDGDNEEDGAN